MNEEPLGRSPTSEALPPLEDVETALADLDGALEEDDVIEKHYYVRSAMQRLQLVLERSESANAR